MKKLILVFFPIILFIFPFKVHAQALPDISNSTFQVIDGGQGVLFDSYFGSQGLYPISQNASSQVISNFLGGADVYLTSSDFTVRPLSDIEKENIQSNFNTHFYDNTGRELSVNNLYYCEGSNGYVTAEFYIDSSGNLLFQDPNQSNYFLNVGLDNTKLSQYHNYFNWNEVYSDLATRIQNGNFNYFPDSITGNANEYFLWVGETAGGKPAKAGYILINNQNIPGTIVPVNTSGSIWHWYTNDLSLIQSVTTKGNFNPTTYATGNYSYNGYTYRYYVTGMNPAGLPNPINYDDWLNGTYGRCFGKEGTLWSELTPVENSIGFKKVRTPELPILSPDEMYDYNELQELQPEAVPEANPDFNPSSPIAPDNYPITYPFPGTVVNPSNLPLPGANNQLDPDPSPYGDLVTIDPTETLPDTIPLIDNLQNRFPFSIPWDIKRLLQGLSAQRQIPVFEATWYIQPLDYTWEFSLDLTDFDGIAQLFRTCFLISFIIGLALFSFKHFFGS